MPSDIEMTDCDSSSESGLLEIDPSIAASLTRGAQRVVYKGKEYLRHPGIRASRVPLVIWNTGEEYERNGKKH
jgi:hypothetical protein